LKHVPNGIIIVLGLVSTKVPTVSASVTVFDIGYSIDTLQMEAAEEIKERVYQAASVMTNSERTAEQALNQCVDTVIFFFSFDQC